MDNKYTSFLLKYPKTFLSISVLLIIPCVFGYLNTGVNYNILSYLPDEMETVQSQETMSESFGDMSFLMLLAENMASGEISVLEKNVESTDGVKTAIWLDDIVGAGMPTDIVPQSLKDIFYNSDETCTMMFVQLEDGADAQDAVKSIRKIMPDNAFLSGTSAISVDTKSITDREVPIYIAAAVAAVFAILILSSSSWLVPVLLMLNLGLGIVYNMGTNFVFGEISYITESIAAVLQLGITMDYSVFLLDRYNEEKRKNPDRTRAMSDAVISTFKSISGSTLTTVSGFVALCFMKLTLGADIGRVMIKGTLLGALTVVTVFPCLLLVFDKPASRYRHRIIVPQFHILNRFTVKHRRIFLIVSVVLLFPAFIAQSQTEKYYNFVNSLPENLPSAVALNKLKTEFDMATSHFIIADDDMRSADFSDMIEEIEETDGITAVIAYNKYVGPAIPDSVVPEEIKSICKRNGKQIMLVNSSYMPATDDCNAQLDRLDSIIKSYDETASISGEGVLYRDVMNITETDFKVTSIISAALIFALIALFFRSATVSILLVLLIELAIFLNEAIPFITGTSVPFISPAVIGCVQLGATVDYAILMTTRFREELRQGKTRIEAAVKAADTSCISIFRSSLVFAGAMTVVCLFSRLEMIKSICAMLARGAIISAAVIILLLTPMLVFGKNKMPYANGKRGRTENEK